ncbi:MAG: gamma carbonic anhydrase family protein [Gammaproteobacteria bacterium]|nr:gamma carbonic anhydrase family protein [Gammaproteobacteria bacterium]MDD9869030.1 gamma carbonic anhydrase family protein [Gammaproteobacteria bacterium]MDD9886691.1 gamma carbonic anhydrase family protein [Gammaproteobacteria bacterium]
MGIRQYQNRKPRIHPTAFVDEAALVIGDVVVGADSSLWPMSVARGDLAEIRIGERSNIQDGSILHVTGDSRFVPHAWPLHIGSGVTVGHNVILHACTIEDDCLVGMGSTVLDGAVIRTGAMLAAGSLVPPGKTIEGGFLWLGNPARKVRELTGDERDFLLFSAQSYVDLKNAHMPRP